MRCSVVAFMLSFASVTCILAQRDSIEYVNGLPVNNDDTVVNFPNRDYEPATRSVMIPPNQLPEKLMKELDENSLYRGWRKFAVYQNVNTGVYFIRVVAAGDTAIYGLNKNGKPVSYDLKAGEQK